MFEHCLSSFYRERGGFEGLSNSKAIRKVSERL